MTTTANTDAMTGGSPSGPPALRYGWLVSVSDAWEMRLALDFPVDILDFKNPNAGPLAPASPELWRLAAKTIDVTDSRESPIHLSAALGETEQALEFASKVPRSFSFAKAGPSNCTSPDALLRLWDEVRTRLPSTTELVGVAYADHHLAGTLPPECVFELAIQHGMRRVLLDTYTKNGESTVGFLGRDRIESLGHAANEAGLWWALAGSIRLTMVQNLMAVESPISCFAARGDLCETGRSSRLSRARMQLWSQTFRSLDSRLQI